jgi:hypothetical protein
MSLRICLHGRWGLQAGPSSRNSLCRCGASVRVLNSEGAVGDSAFIVFYVLSLGFEPREKC